MKSTGIIRNVDELGRIVIPKEIRKKLNIESSDPVEIYVEGEKIILAKYEEVCYFCGVGAELSPFKNKKLCKECINELKSAF